MFLHPVFDGLIPIGRCGKRPPMATVAAGVTSRLELFFTLRKHGGEPSVSPIIHEKQSRNIARSAKVLA
jgi:hypothetical protein